MTLLTPPVVRFKRLHPDAKEPQRGTPGSAGWDIASISGAVIPPKRTVLIPTGIAIALPPSFVADFRPRSSLAKQGLLTVIGTVDSDYRGEILAAITNTTDRQIAIKVGDRVGQLVIHRLPEVTFEEADELDETARGSGGFGSTGK